MVTLLTLIIAVAFLEAGERAQVRRATGGVRKMVLSRGMGAQTGATPQGPVTSSFSQAVWCAVGRPAG